MNVTVLVSRRGDIADTREKLLTYMKTGLLTPSDRGGVPLLPVPDAKPDEKI